MATISQLVRKPRKPRLKKANVITLKGAPQCSAICSSVRTVTPRKPNSALRKIVDIAMSNGYKSKAYIIGEGHNIQEHAKLLVRGGATRDLPGLRLRVVRGTLDVAGVEGRKQGRSKYGTKKGKK